MLDTLHNAHANNTTITIEYGHVLEPYANNRPTGTIASIDGQRITLNTPQGPHIGWADWIMQIHVGGLR